jgi:hypothetical protein
MEKVLGQPCHSAGHDVTSRSQTDAGVNASIRRRRTVVCSELLMLENLMWKMHGRMRLESYRIIARTIHRSMLSISG